MQCNALSKFRTHIIHHGSLWLILTEKLFRHHTKTSQHNDILFYSALTASVSWINGNSHRHDEHIATVKRKELLLSEIIGLLKLRFQFMFKRKRCFNPSNHKHDVFNMTEWWMAKKTPTTTEAGQKWEFSQWNDIRLLRTLNQMWSREHESVEHGYGQSNTCSLAIMCEFPSPGIKIKTSQGNITSPLQKWIFGRGNSIQLIAAIEIYFQSWWMKCIWKLILAAEN